MHQNDSKLRIIDSLREMPQDHLTSGAVQTAFKKLADPKVALALQRFFKTGPGEYGEGDIFHGVRVPLVRRLVRVFSGMPMDGILSLLRSPYHEERLLALLIWVHQYREGPEDRRRQIFWRYLEQTGQINSWDLVDSSAEHIVGSHLLYRDKAPLTRLAQSGNLWERRIAIMATFYYVRKGRFSETFRLAGILLRDPEELVQKAVGWMLRETGNRDIEAEEAFLKENYRLMPRVMLRYAIEKFPDDKRHKYLKGDV